MLSLYESILKSTGSGKNFYSIGKDYKVIGINVSACSDELYEEFDWEEANKDSFPEFLGEIKEEINKSDWPKTDYAILRKYQNQGSAAHWDPTSIKFSLTQKDPEKSDLVDCVSALGGIIISMQKDNLMNNPETKKYLKKYFKKDIQKYNGTSAPISLPCIFT